MLRRAVLCLLCFAVLQAASTSTRLSWPLKRQRPALRSTLPSLRVLWQRRQRSCGGSTTRTGCQYQVMRVLATTRTLQAACRWWRPSTRLQQVHCTAALPSGANCHSAAQSSCAGIHALDCAGVLPFVQAQMPTPCGCCCWLSWCQRQALSGTGCTLSGSCTLTQSSGSCSTVSRRWCSQDSSR